GTSSTSSTKPAARTIWRRGGTSSTGTPSRSASTRRAEWNGQVPGPGPGTCPEPLAADRRAPRGDVARTRLCRRQHCTDVEMPLDLDLERRGGDGRPGQWRRRPEGRAQKHRAHSHPLHAGVPLEDDYLADERGGRVDPHHEL